MPNFCFNGIRIDMSDPDFSGGIFVLLNIYQSIFKSVTFVYTLYNANVYMLHEVKGLY